MIINNTHVQGIFIYSPDVEYERGDFVVSGDSIHICTAANPTNLANRTVKGIDPAKDSTGNFKMYPGDKVSTAKEYYDYVNGRLSWEFKSSALEVEQALGMEPGTFPNNVVSSRDALPRAVHEGDAYKVGTPTTGYEYAYIPYHEDKYISGNVLNEILQDTFFGVNEEGLITNYVISNGLDDEGNEIIDYSIGGSISNIENGRILDAIMKSPDLNNGMFNVSRSLSEIATLVDRSSEVESVLVKQYTYIDSGVGNKRVRIQELIDPVIGSISYRWAEGNSVSASPYSSTRVYFLNEVAFYDRKAWISNYDNNSDHTPGEDGYWDEYNGDWAYTSITGWTSNYENSSRVVLKQLNSIKSYYAKKIQELEATRQQLVGTFCNREVDMNYVDTRSTTDGTEYDLEAGVNVRMHSSWQYVRSSEGELLNTLRISTLSDAVSLVSSTPFADTYLDPRVINANTVIKVGTRTSFTYSYHRAGDRTNGWIHGRTMDNLLNDFGVSSFSDIFRCPAEEYDDLLLLSPDFPFTVILKDTISGDLSVSKYLQVSQEWELGETLLENSGAGDELTEINYEDLLYNESLLRSSTSLLHATGNPWLVESGSLVSTPEYCTIAPYITSINVGGQIKYLLRPYCSYNVEENDPDLGRVTRDITANPGDLDILNGQDFMYLSEHFDSLSDSFLSGYNNTTVSVWNYLSLGPTIYMTDVKYNVGAIVFDPINPGQLYRCIQTSNTPFPPVSDASYWSSIGSSLEVDNYIPSYENIFNPYEFIDIYNATNDSVVSVSFNPSCFHFDAYINNDPITAVGETIPNVTPFTGMFCIMYPTSGVNGEGNHIDLSGNQSSLAFDIHNAYYAYFDFRDEICHMIRANNEENLDLDGTIAARLFDLIVPYLTGSTQLEDKTTLQQLIGSNITDVDLGNAVSTSLYMNCFNQVFTPELGIFVKVCSRGGQDEYVINTKTYQGVDEYHPVFSSSEFLDKLETSRISYSSTIYTYSPTFPSSASSWLGLCGLAVNDFKGVFVRHLVRSGSNPRQDYLYYMTNDSLLSGYNFRGPERSSGIYYYDNVNSSEDLIFCQDKYCFLTSSSGTPGSAIDPFVDVFSQTPVSEISDTRGLSISSSIIMNISSMDDLQKVLSSFKPGFSIIVTDGSKYYKYGSGVILDLGTTTPDLVTEATYIGGLSYLYNLNRYYFPSAVVKCVDNNNFPQEYRLACNSELTRKGTDGWKTAQGPLTQTLEILGQDTMAAGLDLTNTDVSLQDLMIHKNLSLRVVCKKEIEGVVHYYINGNYWALGNPPVDDSEYPDTISGDYIFNSYHDLPDAFDLGKVRAKTQEGGEMSWYVVQNNVGWLDINIESNGQFFDENLGFYVYPWWTTNRTGYINEDEALHDYLHTCFVVHPNDTNKWIGIVYESDKTYSPGDEIVWNSKKWRCLSGCTGEEPVDGSDYWVYSGDPIFDALTYIPSETSLISNVNPTVPFRLVTKVGSTNGYFVALNTRSSDFGTTCIATFLLEIPIPGTTMIKTHTLTLDLQTDGQYYVDDNTWLSVSHQSGDDSKRTILVHGGTIRNIYYRYRL